MQNTLCGQGKYVVEDRGTSTDNLNLKKYLPFFFFFFFEKIKAFVMIVVEGLRFRVYSGFRKSQS